MLVRTTSVENANTCPLIVCILNVWGFFFLWLKGAWVIVESNHQLCLWHRNPSNDMRSTLVHQNKDSSQFNLNFTTCYNQELDPQRKANSNNWQRPSMFEFVSSCSMECWCCRCRGPMIWWMGNQWALCQLLSAWGHFHTFHWSQSEGRGENY